MQFPAEDKRDKAENIVPMINVVFLLLIFFLMTAQITPPAPLEVSPPRAEGAALDPEQALYVDAAGHLAYGTARDQAALDALANRAADTPLPLYADAALPGSDLARLMTRLAGLGQGRITLIVAAK